MAAAVKGQRRPAVAEEVLHGALEIDFPEADVSTRFDGASPLVEEPWMRSSPRHVRNADADAVAVSLHVMSPPESTKVFEDGVERDVVTHAAARADSFLNAASPPSSGLGV